MKSPIFIFSQPRAGSTLLQRVLLSHPSIASASEPWILLPIVYSWRKDGVFAEYAHDLTHTAVKDFNSAIGGNATMHTAVRTYATTLYEAACKNNELYFLDKTPRYYLIIPEIMKVFPDAKFIFLLRHPLSVYASILSTWNDSTFKRFHSSEIDLKYGPGLLADAVQKYSDRSFVMHYEDLVGDNKSQVIDDMFEYLELETSEEWQKVDEQKLHGNMGDPTGVKEYKKIENQSVYKWKSILNTPFKKWITKRYIASIHSTVWKQLGYPADEMMNDLNATHTRFSKMMIDPISYVFSFMAARLNLYVWYRQKKSKRKTFLR